ncbi:hypothetical protein P692DRAFT_20667960, partial [Suillus brevipes Sb2]
QNYGIYKRMLFDENYGLAATQSLKNKDYFAFVRDFLCSLGCCFTRYPPVFEHHPDAASRSIKECLVDLYGKPELLFFGPDEGTADTMDWAALHARGAETWWKTFT